MNFRLPAKCFIKLCFVYSYTIIYNLNRGKRKNNIKYSCSTKCLNLDFHDTELIKILEYVDAYRIPFKEKDINLLKKITINAKCKDVFEAMRFIRQIRVKYKIIKKTLCFTIRRSAVVQVGIDGHAW